MDYNIKIGGAAGQGIQTIGDTLSAVFARSGYHLFSHQDYESRVRGGHNFTCIRLSDTPVYAPRDPVDVLVALDNASIERHTGELSSDGKVVYDSGGLKRKVDDPRFVDVPFVRLAEEHGGRKVMANTVASGAVLGMLGVEVDLLVEALTRALKHPTPEILEGNERAARAGHSYGVEHCPDCRFAVSGRSVRKMVIEGNQAIALAAIASGCRFYSAYPMTPSTGILNFMASKAADYGLVVEQAEDEMSAINMIQGASFAGVRSMTGTSGGGFALMVEGMSLAGMTETPVVVVLAQRPGPATGFPTRTEQSDLLFGLFAGHGEVPRIAFAPGTPEQAFRAVNRAFDLAEKYQVPALIITDQHYADSRWTLEGIDPETFVYNDYRVGGEAFAELPEYARHSFTDSGVSPLAVPGDAPHLVVTDSDEHDEEGHIVEDAETRVKMVEKRLLRKLPLIGAEMEPPEHYGSDSPEVVLVGWGSNYGVLREAVDALSGEREVAMLHFCDLWPFPLPARQEFLEVLRAARTAICVENNATGKLAWLIRAETGFEFAERINRFDGRPFTCEGLLEEIDGRL
ncbi:MAG: 2-oxoacid:acceptor oxidoreductase subunit alpha [Actinobacteria bacterium]|nr:2-oxoacid:acceptor oxidoreductase subunit alpha [Actinomycetota bacterium]MBU1942555.1 2-oxoacid:acceptor oxidoreductase subunit alpha [Actinomycetota bacterium]MBU2687200.1 2-oxoacid:acceptor oxidoreductase subunit alpha [Actinomycetota bacterium]